MACACRNHRCRAVRLPAAGGAATKAPPQTRRCTAGWPRPRPPFPGCSQTAADMGEQGSKLSAPGGKKKKHIRQAAEVQRPVHPALTHATRVLTLPHALAAGRCIRPARAGRPPTCAQRQEAQCSAVQDVHVLRGSTQSPTRAECCRAAAAVQSINHDMHAMQPACCSHGGATKGIFGIHICACLEQQLHCLPESLHARQHQRSAPVCRQAGQGGQAS